jgi:outer membrane receptor protein involved in Fe transport
VANLSAGFTNASGKVDLRVFANNVNDKRYRLNSSDVSSLGWVNQTYAAPRWYGITATYHF